MTLRPLSAAGIEQRQAQPERSPGCPVRIDCQPSLGGRAEGQRSPGGNTGGGLDICVRNQGQPIAPEHLPLLFDRFYRCDPSRAQPDDSGGLGLAIVRSIMQLHGGSVGVESDAAATRFVLRFPAPR